MTPETWHRLDRRMLLVQPVRELVRFFPALFALLVAGTTSGRMDWWHVGGVLVPVALGVLRYLTTTYRVTDARVELRRGLVSRHLLTTPLDRVRTVDLTASPVHRALGLTTVRIGTGTASSEDEDHLDLDGLPAEQARELRTALLRLGGAEVAPEAAADPVVLRLDPRWARYGPLTGSGLAIAAGVAGALGQGVNVLAPVVDGRDAVDGATALAVPLVTVVVLALVVLVAALSVVGYLVANWGFSLTHTRSRGGRGAWEVRRGLLTTRETTLDEERVRGITLGEPLGLRLAGAARASAIATGLHGEASESAPLAPPAPRDVVVATAGRVLGTAGPTTAVLADHGPRARRRRWTRTLVPSGAVVATAVVLVLTSTVPAWTLAPAPLLLVLAALVARDRAAGLGHALSAGHLVARSGSLTRQREVLQTAAVIGWTFRASWSQRRAGLVSLVATTGGGPQSVTVLDVPEGDAVAVAHAAVPGLLAPFLVSSETKPTAAGLPDS